jgi:hypothetical protein
MQPTAPRTSSRIERHLDGLRDHPALGPPIRFYFRHREQLLYLVVGGWNTVFGYGVWALMQYLLGDYLPYLVVLLLAWPINVLNAYLGYRYIVFPQPGSGAQGASALLTRIPCDARCEPRAAARRPQGDAVQHLRGSGALHRLSGRLQLPRPQVLQFPGRTSRTLR